MLMLAVLLATAAPSNFTASALSSSAIQLSWDSGNASGFTVQRMQQGETNFVTVAGVAGSLRTYVDINLAASTGYLYRIRAWKGNQNNASQWVTPPGAYVYTFPAAAPDFTVTMSPSSATTTQGQGATFGVTVTPTNGFSGQVNFGLVGLPAGAGWSFTPGFTVGTGSSTVNLIITTTTSTQTGTWPLTVTATANGGALSHQTSATLQLNVLVACGPFVSGPKTLVATATDNVAVTRLQFQIDSNDYGPVFTAPPYQYPWNTAGMSNGCHTAYARAWDGAGNMGTAVQQVQVQN